VLICGTLSTPELRSVICHMICLTQVALLMTSVVRANAREYSLDRADIYESLYNFYTSAFSERLLLLLQRYILLPSHKLTQNTVLYVMKSTLFLTAFCWL
jgi:hypothetical protein